MMIKVDNLKNLVKKALDAGEYAHMQPVITKELLHYDILFALDNNELLDELTFQGGTALRLCYGSLRFSEDLDFVGGYDFSTKKIIGIKDCLEKYIGKRYGLEIDVKEPSDLKNEFSHKDINVDKWQIRITTEPKRRDLPKQKIKFEVANIPAYTSSLQPLTINYDFLPDAYKTLIITTESIDEIMSDKLVSLVSCQRYIRYRDIWDLQWLKQQGAKPNKEYVLAKINDYKEQNYSDNLDHMINQLEKIIFSTDFFSEMSRFIPADVQTRTLQKQKFLTVLVNENMALLKVVRDFIT